MRSPQVIRTRKRDVTPYSRTHALITENPTYVGMSRPPHRTGPRNEVQRDKRREKVVKETLLKEAGNGRKSIENMGRPSASRRSGASSC